MTPRPTWTASFPVVCERRCSNEYFAPIFPGCRGWLSCHPLVISIDWFRSARIFTRKRARLRAARPERALHPSRIAAGLSGSTRRQIQSLPGSWAQLKTPLSNSNCSRPRADRPRHGGDAIESAGRRDSRLIGIRRRLLRPGGLYRTSKNALSLFRH